MSSEWVTKSFGDLVDFISSKARAEDVNPETYVSTESMLPNFGGIQTASTVPLSGGVTNFSIDDILFSNIRTYFKKVWRAEFSGHCSNDVLVFRPKDRGVLLPGYLHNLCRWERFTEFSVRTSKGAKMPRGDKDALVQFQFALPPVDVQREIVEILDGLDDRITLLRETNTTLEAIAQALFRSWFVDFDPVHAKMQGRTPEGMDEGTVALFPDSFEESALGPVPKGWRIGRLDDLLVLQRGFDLPAQDRTPGDFPIIAASGPSGTHHKSMVKGPGVVTGRSGVLGRVFLELEDFWPLNTTLWVKEFKAATPCYAYEVLRLLDFKSFNAGSAVPSLNRNHIHGLPYLLPERACIEAFENITLRLHQRSRGNADQIQTLEAVREKLLPRLISGQISLAGAIT